MGLVGTLLVKRGINVLVEQAFDWFDEDVTSFDVYLFDHIFDCRNKVLSGGGGVGFDFIDIVATEVEDRADGAEVKTSGGTDGEADYLILVICALLQRPGFGDGNLNKLTT